MDSLQILATPNGRVLRIVHKMMLHTYESVKDVI